MGLGRPSGAAWGRGSGRVGPSRAGLGGEWGWAGQVGPRGAGPGRGRVGRAEWGWACIEIVRVGVGPSRAE